MTDAENIDVTGVSETEKAEVPVSVETLDVILARIKELTEKRDIINEAIAKHKKAAQRLIGRL